jgi:hypothetical protein
MLGRIIAPRETSAALVGYRVRAWTGDRPLAETTTDGFGRFLLEWPAEVEQASFIAVRAYAPWGDPAGEIRLSPSELLSPNELTFTAVPEPRLPQASAPPVLPAASPEIVSQEAWSLFRQAVAAATDEGYLKEDEARWVEQDVADLDRAHALARAGVEGDSHSLKTLRALLQMESLWKFPLEGVDDLGGLRPSLDNIERCFVLPQDPLSLVWGGLMLDGLKGDLAWSERAAGFFNSRAAPIDAVFEAAATWAEGGMAPGDFAGIVKSYDPTRLGQGWGRPLPQRSTLSPCLSERDVCLGALLFDFQQYGSQRVSDPPRVGSITPDAVCEGYTGPLTLLPPAGSQFPASQPNDWRLVVDGQPIAIRNWNPTGIAIIFPANVRAGCQGIRWFHVLDPEFVSHVRGVGEQCAPFFGGSLGWITFPSGFSEHAVEITVVGVPQIASFTADGQSFIVTEACTDVKLEWKVSLSTCRGSSASTDVSLLADGNLRASALSLMDSLTVSDETTTTFTLRVETFVGATRCSIAERSLQVQRYKTVHLSAPGESGCIDAGSTLPVTVQISCPAPAGGIPVTLASSNPARLAGGTITIPEGSIEDFINLAIGQECGEVTIAATAPGHQSASFKRLISDIPQINAITPPEVDACQSFQVWLDGSCYGERIGQQQASLIDISGNSIQGTVIQLQANTRLLVEFPALEAGRYLLSVTFCGKTGAAASLLTVKDKPPDIKMFSAAPNKIVLCPMAIRLTWRVDGARRVRILRNGVLLPGSERTRSQNCGLWGESFDDPQLQFNSVQYTLEAYPSSGSPVKTAQAPVTAASHTDYIRLAQQGGSSSYIYNNNSVPDPLALCQVKHAVITNVRNDSGYNISLAHGSGGAAFIVINHGDSTSAFNGMPVAGNWSAQVGGRVGSFPAQITIKVDWKNP